MATKHSLALADDVIKNKGYASADLGKVPTVVQSGSDYIMQLTAPATQFHFEIMASLPTAASTYANTIALIAMTAGGVTQNIYKEYACVKTSDSPETWAWELLGSIEASVDQSDASKLVINGTEIKFASYTDASTKQCGIISGDTYNTFNSKQSAIAKSATTGKPQAVVTTDTDGTVDKRDICTDITPAAVTTATTDLVTAGAVKNVTSGKVDIASATAASTPFAIGIDADGPYIEY